MAFFWLCQSLWGQQSCVSGDCIDGYGCLQLDSGEKYYGNFREGDFNGYGILLWNSAHKYIGYWRNGKMHGKGTMISQGQLIKGLWIDNKLEQIEADSFSMEAFQLEAAQKELEKMLDSRPELRHYTQAMDLLKQWLILKFAGADIGQAIHWQDSAHGGFQIPEKVNAVHAYPTAQNKAMIWIREGLPAEQMWACLIFELINICNGPAFQEIETAALKWQINKAEYVRRFTQLEFETAHKTRQFYLEVWQPMMRSQQLDSDAQYWFYYIPDRFEDWWTGFQDRSQYPFYPYEQFYERTIKKGIRSY